MISITKKAQITPTTIPQPSQRNDRPQLSARWSKVNGKLICRWVSS